MENILQVVEINNENKITEWIDNEKGLRKEIIKFDSKEIDKPSDVSKCSVQITDYKKDDSENYKTNYLLNTDEFSINLGNAITPIDIYVETFLKEMTVGELSKCVIKTKKGKEISFFINLIKIEENKYYYELTPNELIAVVKQYKENGVLLFKEYPIFAQQYFVKSAKLLLSLNNYKSDDESNAYDINETKLLLENVYINITACLCLEKRYTDIIELLKFINITAYNKDNINAIITKGIYRKSLALYHIKDYITAKQLIELVDYKDNEKFNKLYNNICIEINNDNRNYCNMVKKMFK